MQQKFQIMGIVNLTPDSFYSRSRCYGSQSVREAIGRLTEAGADIIDVGCCSTRPGAPVIAEADELSRLRNGFENIPRDEVKARLSIDTFRSSVAREAVECYGFDIVNDISGGEADSAMFATVASLGAGYVLTHPGQNIVKPDGTVCNEGLPEKDFHEDAYLAGVLRYFGERLRTLRYEGVVEVYVDPGIGFGKNMEQNFCLLRNLRLLARELDAPVLVGLSRKSLVWQTLGVDVDDSLNGTTVLNTVALLNGASVLRVHDVNEARQAAILCSRVM